MSSWNVALCWLACGISKSPRESAAFPTPSYEPSPRRRSRGLGHNRHLDLEYHHLRPRSAASPVCWVTRQKRVASHPLHGRFRHLRLIATKELARGASHPSRWMADGNHVDV